MVRDFAAIHQSPEEAQRIESVAPGRLGNILTEPLIHKFPPDLIGGFSAPSAAILQKGVP